MSKPYVIGIDIGGTHTIYGIVDAGGSILYSGSINTRDYPDIELYITALTEGLQDIIQQIGGNELIKGIGIGVPMGNYLTGCIENAVNLPWKGDIPLARLVSDNTYHIPVAVTNDANAAAVGEMAYGVARGMKNFIVITLGTGVGSGIVVDGNLVYGHDGFAGELGHVIVRREKGRMCGCGRSGCLEAYTSATGVARTARELLSTCTDPCLLRDLNPETITSKDVYEAAQKGDKLSLEVFELTGEILGEAFADFVLFSSPEAIILCGGLAQAGDLLLNPIRRALNNKSLSMFVGKTKLLLSQLEENNAAILGASALGRKAKR